MIEPLYVAPRRWVDAFAEHVQREANLGVCLAQEFQMLLGKQDGQNGTEAASGLSGF